MSGTRPLPPPLAVALPLLQRTRALLTWGFGVSIALHAIFGPIVGMYKTPRRDTPEISTVSLSQRTTVKLPARTPRPTKPPTPPPDRATPPPSRITPPPGRTPPPILVRAAPSRALLKINVYKRTTMSNASSGKEKYHVQTGSQEGVPQGTLG